MTEVRLKADRDIAIRCKICGEHVIIPLPYTWREFLKKHRCIEEVSE